jgi:hypothetical protein
MAVTSEGAQHDPGIEGLGQFPDQPHGVDHRQAPHAGGNAAHDQHLEGWRIGERQLHAGVVRHESAGRKDDRADAAQVL